MNLQEKENYFSNGVMDIDDLYKEEDPEVEELVNYSLIAKLVSKKYEKQLDIRRYISEI